MQEDELHATHRQAEKARVDAALWAARADAPDTDSAAAARLRADATAAQQEADDLAPRAAVLEEADQARAVWFTHTAVTRDNAHRARTELRARGIDPDDPDDRVTAQEWLDAHEAEQADADRDRPIREEHEIDEALADEQPAVETAGVAETAIPDLRETSAADPTERADPETRRRVPSIDETADAVARAQGCARRGRRAAGGRRRPRRAGSRGVHSPRRPRELARRTRGRRRARRRDEARNRVGTLRTLSGWRCGYRVAEASTRCRTWRQYRSASVSAWSRAARSAACHAASGGPARVR